MRFRLLTYNIHRAIGLDRKFMPERIVALLRHHAADIVLLQEVDRGAPRSRMLDLAGHLARELEYSYQAVGMNVFLKQGQYGNATLSRFPIGRQRNIDLTIGRAKRRGCQHTRIHLPCAGGGCDLDIFNIHLSLLAHLRRAQLQRLFATSDMAHLTLADPCIVAGDTNDWPGVLRVRDFGPRGFRCATNSGRTGRRVLRTFPSFAPTGGLDKVFFRGPLRALHVATSHLQVARVASDHLPVIADFELQRLRHHATPPR